MVVIITGASHTGKTKLAQAMMEKYAYPYVSEDHIKMGLIRSGYTDLTPEDDDKMTDYLWPVIREIVKTAVENNQNLIIEGCYVPFDWQKDFTDEYLNQIWFVCLCLSDAYIDNHFDDIKKYASCIESRLDDDWLTADYLKRENGFYRKGCRRNNLNVVLIENDYIGEINGISLPKKFVEQTIPEKRI